MRTDFLILGSGPTGIGAALNLAQRHARFLVVDGAEAAGGLAGSVVDGQGFTWDNGGHVQFSHYDRFDEWMDRALGTEGWVEHRRESWIWMRDRFIPYPLQNNIDCLPAAEYESALAGLRLARAQPAPPPANFREWVDASFGPGLAEIFMLPYNRKVWAHPLELMSWQWVGERVAPPDPERVAKPAAGGASTWGPNRTFRYPLKGGTGAIWRRLAETLPSATLRLADGVVAIDPKRHAATLQSGESVTYQHLLSTMPLDRLTVLVGDGELAAAAAGLAHSTTHVVGIGIEGTPPVSIRPVNWMYFPEPQVPFYRVTVFSNYSPNNVPRPGTWSLMAEVAESEYAPVDGGAVTAAVEGAMRAIGLVEPGQRVLSRWHAVLPYGYPIPTVDRDAILARVLPGLESMAIYSRGRFGAWKYEVANQDHSFMQGWEWADGISDGGLPEAEVTLNHPEVANSGRFRSAG